MVGLRNIFQFQKEMSLKFCGSRLGYSWKLSCNFSNTISCPKGSITKINELVFGASGNTGMIAVQLGKKMGAKIIAVSKDNWIKTDFGANYIINDE